MESDDVPWNNQYAPNLKNNKSSKLILGPQMYNLWIVTNTTGWDK